MYKNVKKIENNKLELELPDYLIGKTIEIYIIAPDDKKLQYQKYQKEYIDDKFGN